MDKAEMTAYNIANMCELPIAPDMLATACYEVARRNGFYESTHPVQVWEDVLDKAVEELTEADGEAVDSVQHAAEVRDAIMVLIGYHVYLQQRLPPGQGLDVQIMEKLRHNIKRGYRHGNDT